MARPQESVRQSGPGTAAPGTGHGGTQDGETPEPSSTDHGARLADSRTALISLIDRLSHRSALFLVLTGIGALGIALGAVIGARSWAVLGAAIAWLTMTAVPLKIAMRSLSRYRSGLTWSGRPLSWRARHGAALAVISAALGSGALILGPAGGPVLVHAVAWLAMMLALGHIAHAPAAFSAGLPGIAIAALSLGVMPPPGEAALWTLVFSVSGLVIAACWGVWHHGQLVRQALEDHPRRETPQITARRKKAPRAWNPYKLRPKKDEEHPRPYLYRPETAKR